MAIISLDDAPGFQQQAGESFDAYYRRTDALLTEMMDRSAGLADGEVVGAILSFPIADGKALYVVQKAEPLTLQHIPFMDAYEIPAAHMRGIDITDVQDQLKHGKAMVALMRRKKA